uniref:Uncharacterized protein n=1 Tax=Anguilla anguilla TaxID=7936 RepID=A0A0E9X0U5_ANGAN
MYFHGATIANSIIMPKTEDIVRNAVTSVYFSDCPRSMTSVSAVLYFGKWFPWIHTYPTSAHLTTLVGALKTLLACASVLYYSTFFSNLRQNNKKVGVIRAFTLHHFVFVWH